MPAHIRKGLITGAPAFNSGGLGLSIGSRVGGARRMISARAPDGGKSTPAPRLFFTVENPGTYGPKTAIVRADSEPYISNFNFTPIEVSEGTPLAIFNKKHLNSFNIGFNVTDVSHNLTFSVSIQPITPGTPGLQNYITYPSENEIQVVIPDFNGTASDTVPMSQTDISGSSKENAGDTVNPTLFYINSGKLTKTATLSGVMFGVTQIGTGTNYSSTNALRTKFNTALKTISGTYKFKLANSTDVTITSTNGFNQDAITYIYDDGMI